MADSNPEEKGPVLDEDQGNIIASVLQSTEFTSMLTEALLPKIVDSLKGSFEQHTNAQSSDTPGRSPGSTKGTNFTSLNSGSTKRSSTPLRLWVNNRQE